MSKVKIERAEMQGGKITRIEHHYNALLVTKPGNEYLELTMFDRHDEVELGDSMTRLLTPEEVRDLGHALVEMAEGYIR